MRRPPTLAAFAPLVLALVAVAGLLALATPTRAAGDAPAPVVLLHGWHGEGDDTLEGSSLAPLGPRLRAAGHPLRWADGIGLDRSESVYDAAERLGVVLREEARAHPGRPLSIVAHSYGGIVARAYLESDRYAQDRREGLRVGALVTVGTPMAGIDLWLPLLFLLGDPTDEPSVWELTPAFMEHFNRAHRPRPDLRYTLVAGDARRQVAALRLLPASDGVVTLGSALSLDERRFGHRETVTGDLHGEMGPSWLGWEHYFESARTWREAILPGLSPLEAGAAPIPAARSVPDLDSADIDQAGPDALAWQPDADSLSQRSGPAVLVDAASLAAARGADPAAAFLLAGRGPGAERAARASDGFRVTGLPGVAPFWAWIAPPGGPAAAIATGDATVAAMALGGAGRAAAALDKAGQRDPRLGEDADGYSSSLGPGYHVLTQRNVEGGSRETLARTASAERAIVRPDPEAGALEALVREEDGLRVALRLRDAGRYLLRAELAGGQAVSAWRMLPAGRSEPWLALDESAGSGAGAGRPGAGGRREPARVWLWAADAGLVPILEGASTDLHAEAPSADR